MPVPIPSSAITPGFSLGHSFWGEMHSLCKKGLKGKETDQKNKKVKQFRTLKWGRGVFKTANVPFLLWKGCSI